MKKILIIVGLFLLYGCIKETWAIECQDPDNTDFCVEVGYNKNKQPPNNIPLNITATLDIKVFWLHIRILILRRFFCNDLANSLLFSSLKPNIENNLRCLLKLQEVSGVDDSALSISIRLVFYVYWNDSRVVRLKEGDRSMQLGFQNVDKYFLPDFYIYNLLGFQLSEFADPLKTIFLTPDSRMW